MQETSYTTGIMGDLNADGTPRVGRPIVEPWKCPIPQRQYGAIIMSITEQTSFSSWKNKYESAIIDGASYFQIEDHPSAVTAGETSAINDE